MVLPGCRRRHQAKLSSQRRWALNFPSFQCSSNYKTFRSVQKNFLSQLFSYSRLTYAKCYVYGVVLLGSWKIQPVSQVQPKSEEKPQRTWRRSPTKPVIANAVAIKHGARAVRLERIFSSVSLPIFLLLFPVPMNYYCEMRYSIGCLDMHKRDV